MSHAKVAVRGLLGLALDHAAAQIDPLCEGLSWRMLDGILCGGFDDDGHWRVASFITRGLAGRNGAIRARSLHLYACRYAPHTDWLQCGRLVDHFDIDLVRLKQPSELERFEAISPCGCRCSGPTRLIAAVRCAVLMRRGEYVQVPSFLLDEPKVAHAAPVQPVVA